MTSVLRRLQDWYKGNCDGDWEHCYGVKIETVDNPGWVVKLGLQETALEEIQITRKFQNPNDENDWFTFEIKDGSLTIGCGRDNLEQVLTIFLDEIARGHK